MSRTPSWVTRGDELLADGEWHDGYAWVLEVEKGITPGVAQRHTEATRRAQAARRVGVTTEEAPERTRPLSTGAQIASGKRAMVTTLVHSRVRFGTMEVDPWPLPEGGWKQGGWRLRAVPRLTPTELANRYHIAQETIRSLILDAPALKHEWRGRKFTVTHDVLPELDQRVQSYLQEGSIRRSKAGRRRWQEAAKQEPLELSIRALASRGHISPETAKRLAEEHPELGWIMRGTRIQVLPVYQLPAWDLIVREYHRAAGGRRSAAARARHRRRRESNSDGQ